MSLLDPWTFAMDQPPADFIESFNLVAPGFNEQVAAQATSDKPWYETALAALSGLVMTDYQRKILNLQLDRAAKGLPALDASAFGVGVNVGLSPDVKKLLLLGGAALLAVLVLKRR